MTPRARIRILWVVMVRRLASLLLTAVLAVAGLAVGPCPGGRCAMLQAPAMACCQQGGLTKPSCCPPLEQVGQRATPPAAERPADIVAQAAAQPLPVALALPVAPLPAPPPRIASGGEPPGTLIAQHTSLLV